MPETDHPRYAPPGHAGVYAGASERSIRRMVKSGQLTAYYIGHVLRVDLNELDEIMRSAAGRPPAPPSVPGLTGSTCSGGAAGGPDAA